MTYEQLAVEVDIVKKQLSGFRDPAIKGLLPGAERVAIGACKLLDELLAALKPTAPTGDATARTGYFIGPDGYAAKVP